MTCVVALVHDSDNISMGWDSAFANTTSLDLHGEGSHKAFARKIGTETCLIGGSGSGRLIPLLEYDFEFPPLPSSSPGEMMRWLTIDVLRKLRVVLKEAGVLTTKEGVDTCPGSLLVGIRGKLYEVSSDLAIRSISDRFGAIGSGAPEAKGVMFGITKLNINVNPETLILTALEAAERWTPGVRRPFQIISSTVSTGE